MKIGFDARMIRHSGIGTYIRHLLNNLTLKEELNFTLFGPLEKIADYPARKVSAPWSIYSLKEQILFPPLLKREEIPLLHVPHYNAPILFHGNLVVTIHDLIHLHYPPSRMAYCYARTVLEIVCKKSKKIITVSEHSKKDLVHLLNVPESKIHVVYHGIETPHPFTPLKESGEKNSIPYLLYVGNIKSTKNVSTLLEAFTMVLPKIKEIKCVIAGKDFMPEMTQKYRSHPQIQFLGELSERQLQSLYAGAKLFVFPSLYEGFGFPPLEAMSYGVPVLSSSAASLPEAIGNAAEYFDPHKPNELAEKIIFYWNNSQERNELIQKGFENILRFSWGKCAQETEKIYASL